MKHQNNDPYVTLNGVEVVYPNGTVGLKPLDLRLAGNQVTVLLGPSGAGKSTLLRVLNHLVPPTRGTVTVRDAEPLSDPNALRNHRRQTAMVFQQHQLIGRMTALQNVLLGRLGHYSFWRTLLPMPAVERRWALECLERVGLFDRALTRCDSMSGGQQQRVGIARALAQRPRLILADEPVASLDPTASERLLRQLRTICEEDKVPVVISLHQLEYARVYADRIIGLAQGEVAFDGPPAAMTDDVLYRIYGATQQAEAADEPTLQTGVA